MVHWTALESQIRHTSLRYDATLRYVECVHCVPDSAAISARKAEDLKILLRSDRAAGRVQAKLQPLLIYRQRELQRHFKTCVKVPAEVKATAHAVNDSAKQPKGEKKGENLDIVPERSLKRDNHGLKQTKMSEFGRDGKRFKYDTSEYARLVANSVSAYNISFSYFSSNLFRQLAAFLVGGDDALKRGRLLINPNKIRKVMLPLRYKEATEAIASRFRDDVLDRVLRYTFSDDGWSSKSKKHFLAVCIGRPGMISICVALVQLEPDSMHGVAVARGWELVALEDKATSGSTLNGYVIALNEAPFAFVSDSSGANTRARKIAALRNPRNVFLECFAHVFALICGDLLTKSVSAGVTAQAAFVVEFMNSSSCLWLALLQKEQVLLHGKEKALISGCVTRWTSMWMLMSSVLESKQALQRVLLRKQGSKLVANARTTRDKRDDRLRRLISIIESTTFWEKLAAQLIVMIPCIESSLVIQGGDCTLSHVLYSFGRQYQALEQRQEAAALSALERRFSNVEYPLLACALLLHPRFRAVAIQQQQAGLVSLMFLKKSITLYLCRWSTDFRDPGVKLPKVALAIQKWISGKADWVAMADEFEDAGKYWEFVYCSYEPLATKTDASGHDSSIFQLAFFAVHLFSVLPNAADPERVFSTLGRVMPPSRTRLTHQQSRRMLIISKDYQSTGAARKNASGVASRGGRRMSERASLVIKLRLAEESGANGFSPGDVAGGRSSGAASTRIAQNAGFRIHEDTESPIDDDDDDEDEEDIGFGDVISEGGSDCWNASVDKGELSVEEACGQEDEIADAAQDDAVHAAAVDDFAGFQAELLRVIEEYDAGVHDASDTTTDIDLAPVTEDIGASLEMQRQSILCDDALDDDDDNAYWDSAIPLASAVEEVKRKASLQRHPAGKLPIQNDHFIPKEDLRDDPDGRGVKVKLADLFDISKIGILPGLTTMFSLQE